jgi:predicted site-specific integrase-resolvase
MMKPIPELLTIEDVAARWGVEIWTARRRVKNGKVPFLSLSSRSMQINWGNVRFPLETLVEWERANTVAYEEQAPSPGRGRGLAGANWEWRR